MIDPYEWHQREREKWAERKARLDQLDILLEMERRKKGVLPSWPEKPLPPTHPGVWLR